MNADMTQQAQSIDMRGKHRVIAELKRLEQETRFVEIPFGDTQVQAVCGIVSKFVYDILCEVVTEAMHMQNGKDKEGENIVNSTSSHVKAPEGPLHENEMATLSVNRSSPKFDDDHELSLAISFSYVCNQEELEQLGKTENATAVCSELLSIVEAKPDPLLPETIGPVNPFWDRWFEGPQDSKGCRCWIF
ncbi:Guanine nucleotide-binding protein subunit gamma 1 [Bienertia sinuspersici]